MSKLQLFKDFVNERLAAAASEIFGLYEETLAECQEEICRAMDRNAQLQKLLDIVLQPEIKLHRTGSVFIPSSAVTLVRDTIQFLVVIYLILAM